MESYALVRHTLQRIVNELPEKTINIAKKHDKLDPRDTLTGTSSHNRQRLSIYRPTEENRTEVAIQRNENQPKLNSAETTIERLQSKIAVKDQKIKKLQNQIQQLELQFEKSPGLQPGNIENDGHASEGVRRSIDEHEQTINQSQVSVVGVDDDDDDEVEVEVVEEGYVLFDNSGDDIGSSIDYSKPLTAWTRLNKRSIKFEYSNEAEGLRCHLTEACKRLGVSGIKSHAKLRSGPTDMKEFVQRMNKPVVPGRIKLAKSVKSKTDNKTQS
ncbi:hypothetical protein HK098_002247 [Nowakowskiella sp. JEL0407]|nr:hypothetical protein HK098_002247 [Nowakowskiella sp. JEL0407]